MSATMTDTAERVETLVLFLTQVANGTAACATHGDAATFDASCSAHAFFAEAARVAGGRVVKALGDGALIVFPSSRAREAIAAMRHARDAADLRWKALDARCVVQVKGTAGPVLVGQIGGREDVYGNTVNQLFKAPAASFTLSSELASLDG